MSGNGRNEFMNKKVIVIGGGPAGMQAAVSLAAQGLKPVIVERADTLGGKLRDWHRLFPSMTPADDVLGELTRRVADEKIEVMTGSEVESLSPGKGVTLANGQTLAADAVVVASGFDIFDARAKEEYGYGVYANVFTTVDVERMLNEGSVALADGNTPRRIAIVHCVGSRDEKVNQRHCSKVCCITAVKQAMELRALFPDADVFNFYMDIRMFGPGYEELYQQAQQECAINFIRGRVSEASPTIDGRIQIKAEDTLVGRPMKMTVDMLVLAVGMRAAATNGRLGLTLAPSGFFAPADLFAGCVESGATGVFFAGTATAPKTIGETIAEGAMAAEKVAEYLKNK
jgi:heterodisulfide reductase subunit A